MLLGIAVTSIALVPYNKWYNSRYGHQDKDKIIGGLDRQDLEFPPTKSFV